MRSVDTLKVGQHEDVEQFGAGERNRGRPGAASPLWQTFMRLDLIDELQVSLFPYVAGEGTRLFDGVPKSYRLDLVSSTASSSGIVELQYRRHR
jgi:hypothetical protein